MDDDYKWFAIMFIVIVLSIAIATSFKEYNDRVMSQEAIKAGLVQEVVDGQAIWVKND